MDETKNRIKKLLGKAKRRGMSKLVEAMEEGGFFTAPCSGKFHLCEEGGLAKHSLNVYDQMITIAKAEYGKITADMHRSIIICSLLHDLGKMGDHGKENYVPNILASGNQSTSKPYETNKGLAYIDHAIRSLMIAERYIKLTEEEEQAILYHNGKYTHIGYDLKESEMQMLLHFADMWASRVIEGGDE